VNDLAVHRLTVELPRGLHFHPGHGRFGDRHLEDDLSKDLKRRSFTFACSTISYTFDSGGRVGRRSPCWMLSPSGCGSREQELLRMTTWWTGTAASAGRERPARRRPRQSRLPRPSTRLKMKFFTPDLIECFGSDDHGVALTAQTHLEQRAAEYSRSLGEIELELPQRFRELLDRYYLHDARVIDHSFLRNGDSGSLRGTEPRASTTGRKSVERASVEVQ
jgi:hypothetical protein